MQCYPFIHSPDTTAEPVENLRLVCASDCPAHSVEWLWPGKIAIGKVTLLVGDPGTGKSLLALDIAARVSRAGAWPEHKAATVGRATSGDDTRVGEGENGRGGDSIHSSRHSTTPPTPSAIHNPQSAIPGTPWVPQSPVSPSSVILLSATDDLADTIRPRLDAAGADPRRVFVVPSIADLRDDFAQLRVAVNCAPNCRLIIIDPVNAYVGPSDSHFQTVVRKVLAPLAQLAAEKRIAVLAVAHLRKNDGAAIYRAAGSMGFVAAARAVWTVCRDHDNPGRQLFLPLKNNLGPAACGLAYSIEPRGPNGAAAISWHSTPITTSAEEALRSPQYTDLHAARQWLRQTLAQGPRSASEVTQEAAHHGFHERTLRRALHAIGGCTQNRGLLEGWWWSIPGAPTDDRGLAHFAQSAEQNVPGTIAAMVPFAEDDPQKPVPLCPLPKIFNDPPTLHPSPDPPTVSESITALDRRRTGRFSGQFPQASPRRRRKTTAAAPHPSKTGNPMLDGLLDSLRQSLPTKPHNSQQTPLDSS